jgi:hypothetical protein
MPLTRHLYELDEVTSALQTCLRKGWPRAHYWLWELLQSDEHDLALNSLQNAWILFGAPFDKNLLTLEPTDPDSWISLLRRIEIAIQTAKKDAVFYMLQRTDEVESESITKENFAATLKTACSENKKRIALRILKEAKTNKILTDDEIDKLIGSNYDSEDPEIRLALQAIAVLSMCPSTHTESQNEEKDTIKPHMKRTWASWTPLIGTRKARIYEIPTEALTPTTTRGSLSSRYTNIGELRDPVPSLFEGCAWWRARLEAIGAIQDEETGAVIFPNDDVLETFYAAHFPDDIPDEWSMEDQLKSHGRGHGGQKS